MFMKNFKENEGKKIERKSKREKKMKEHKKYN